MGGLLKALEELDCDRLRGASSVQQSNEMSGRGTRKKWPGCEEKKQPCDTDMGGTHAPEPGASYLCLFLDELRLLGAEYGPSDTTRRRAIHQRFRRMTQRRQTYDSAVGITPSLYLHAPRRPETPASRCPQTHTSPAHPDEPCQHFRYRHGPFTRPFSAAFRPVNRMIQRKACVPACR